jgi:hypothetical protein
VNRRRESRRKTPRRASRALTDPPTPAAEPRSVGDSVEESLERNQKALEAARQALKPLSATENKETQPTQSSAHPLAMMTLPDDPDERRMFGARVAAEFQSWFEGRLTPEDLALYHSEGPWSKKISGLFDKTIIDFAQTFGWRVYLSEVVQNQMARWHDAGRVHLIKQLGEAVTLAAKVAHGRASLPITDPELKVNKQHAVDELRRLLKQSQRVFKQYRTRPNDQKVSEWLRKTIEASPQAFPFWQSPNIDSLLQYLRDQKRGSTFFRKIALGEAVQPASLFDEWGADLHNLSPVTFRQKVSELPASKL